MFSLLCGAGDVIPSGWLELIKVKKVGIVVTTIAIWHPQLHFLCCVLQVVWFRNYGVQDHVLPGYAGEGTFGVVVQAKAEDIVKSAPHRNIVAVKTTRGMHILTGCGAKHHQLAPQTKFIEPLSRES